MRESLAAVNAALCAALGDVAVPRLRRPRRPARSARAAARPRSATRCRAGPRAILDALARRAVPVVAPLAVGPLNVNADDAAAALALGLGARSLVFLTDVPGLYIDGDLVDSIGAARSRARSLDAGAFDGGIVPKLRAAAIAAARGISAHIGSTAVVA